MLQLAWTMFISRAIGFSLVCAVAVIAKPLQIVDENSLNPSVSNIVHPLVLNTSTDILAPDPSANWLLECNGALYGFNPNIADCERAAGTINPDGDQMTWGERHTGLPLDVFALPFAVFGGKLRVVMEKT